MGVAPPEADTYFDASGLSPETHFSYRLEATNATLSTISKATASATSSRVPTTSRFTPINEGLPLSVDEDRSLRAPDAITLNDGKRLIIAYTKGSWKNSCNIVAQISSDNGKSWSKAFTLLDMDQSVGKPEFYRISDSLIGMTYSKWHEGISYRAFRSTEDDGKTWSAESLIATGQYGRNSAGCIARNGRLITVLGKADKPKRHAISVSWSDDQGATWSQPRLVSQKPLGESAAVHAGDGRILILTRSKYNSEPYYHLFESFDNGETWTERPASHGIWGGSDNPPELSRIPNTNTLVAIVNGYKTTDARIQKNRRHTYALASNDFGKTWEFLTNIDYFMAPTSGYDASQAANFSLFWNGRTPILVTGNDGSLHPQGANGEASELRFISITELDL